MRQKEFDARLFKEQQEKNFAYGKTIGSLETQLELYKRDYGSGNTAKVGNVSRPANEAAPRSKWAPVQTPAPCTTAPTAQQCMAGDYSELFDPASVRNMGWAANIEDDVRENLYEYLNDGTARVPCQFHLSRTKGRGAQCKYRAEVLIVLPDPYYSRVKLFVLCHKHAQHRPLSPDRVNRNTWNGSDGYHREAAYSAEVCV